jgi:hypothetical protein
LGTEERSTAAYSDTAILPVFSVSNISQGDCQGPRRFKEKVGVIKKYFCGSSNEKAESAIPKDKKEESLMIHYELASLSSVETFS